MYKCATWRQSLIPPSPAAPHPPAVARPWPARLRVHQLSESASLFPSALFSAEFHFCDFSDSSEEERFCLLHLARLFLNQTYT